MPKQEIIELQTCIKLRWNGKNDAIKQEIIELQTCIKLRWNGKNDAIINFIK